MKTINIRRCILVIVNFMSSSITSCSHFVKAVSIEPRVVFRCSLRIHPMCLSCSVVYTHSHGWHRGITVSNILREFYQCHSIPALLSLLYTSLLSFSVVKENPVLPSPCHPPLACIPFPPSDSYFIIQVL